MATWSGRGAALRLTVGTPPAVALFGESPSRIVLEARPADVPVLLGRAAAAGLPLAILGATGGDRLAIELVGEGATGAAEERGARVADAVDVRLDDLRHAWERGLPRALGEEA
jgi:phosphoribosylformylglycinamidine synthase